MFVRLDVFTPAGWQGDDSGTVKLDTCRQCGAVVMVSDPKAMQLHQFWHTTLVRDV